MKYFGPVHWRYPDGLSQSRLSFYASVARQGLGEIVRRAQLGGVDVLTQTIHLDDGTAIHVGKWHSVLTAHIEAIPDALDAARIIAHFVPWFLIDGQGFIRTHVLSDSQWLSRNNGTAYNVPWVNNQDQYDLLTIRGPKGLYVWDQVPGDDTIANPTEDWVWSFATYHGEILATPPGGQVGIARFEKTNRLIAITNGNVYTATPDNFSPQSAWTEVAGEITPVKDYTPFSWDQQGRQAVRAGYNAVNLGGPTAVHRETVEITGELPNIAASYQRSANSFPQFITNNPPDPGSFHGYPLGFNDPFGTFGGSSEWYAFCLMQVADGLGQPIKKHVSGSTTRTVTGNPFDIFGSGTIQDVGSVSTFTSGTWSVPATCTNKNVTGLEVTFSIVGSFVSTLNETKTINSGGLSARVATVTSSASCRITANIPGVGAVVILDAQEDSSHSADPEDRFNNITTSYSLRETYRYVGLVSSSGDAMISVDNRRGQLSGSEIIYTRDANLESVFSFPEGVYDSQFGTDDSHLFPLFFHNIYVQSDIPVVTTEGDATVVVDFLEERSPDWSITMSGASISNDNTTIPTWPIDTEITPFWCRGSYLSTLVAMEFNVQGNGDAGRQVTHTHPVAIAYDINDIERTIEATVNADRNISATGQFDGVWRFEIEDPTFATGARYLQTRTVNEYSNYGVSAINIALRDHKGSMLDATIDVVSHQGFEQRVIQYEWERKTTLEWFLQGFPDPHFLTLIINDITGTGGGSIIAQGDFIGMLYLDPATSSAVYLKRQQGDSNDTLHVVLDGVTKTYPVGIQRSGCNNQLTDNISDFKASDETFIFIPRYARTQYVESAVATRRIDGSVYMQCYVRVFDDDAQEEWIFSQILGIVGADIFEVSEFPRQRITQIGVW